MIGGYDKTAMHLDEDSMRAEIEHLLPAIRSGRYISSVDHQTPSDVTLENYTIYVSLLKEYAQKTMQKQKNAMNKLRSHQAIFNQAKREISRFAYFIRKRPKMVKAVSLFPVSRISCGMPFQLLIF